MELDIKKIIETPADQWEAIEQGSTAQQHLLSALHIMISALTFDTDVDREINKRRMQEFVNKFTK